jgi:prepilin-type N-terminal cleavage/methylation domain-containing protein
MQSKLKSTGSVILEKFKISQNIKTLYSKKIKNLSMSLFIKDEKTSSPFLSKREGLGVRLAFTLVEMIVVITILAIL